MKIVYAPHQALRQSAKPVVTVDKKLHTFVTEISTTLKTNERRGVGLAAPQVDKQWRLFVTYLAPGDERDGTEELPRQLNVYINPRITKSSPKKELGGSPDSRPLEGCLSIPTLYGPVPRYPWVEIEYETIKNDSLISNKQKFTGFPARLVQHEIDHLDGILFTDYCLELNLPIYQEDKNDKLTEIDDYTLVELF